MKHFVLVHGICHGAWCWYMVVTLLKQEGHQVTAIDLAGCGISAKPQCDVLRVDDYVEPLLSFMESLTDDEKVILVGHSFGGIAISFAMEKFPERVSAAVFVSAYMPSPSFSPALFLEETLKRTTAEELLDVTFWYDNGPVNAPTSALFGPDILAARLYQKCPLEDLELAKLLVKKRDGLFSVGLAKDYLFSEDRFGTVNRVFVMLEEDEMMKRDFQQWIIEKSPPQQVKSIAKADHMSMLSTPKELCLILLEICH